MTQSNMWVPKLHDAHLAALDAAGEHFAAGLFRGDGVSMYERFARAHQHTFRRMELPVYTGGLLYVLHPGDPLHSYVGVNDRMLLKHGYVGLTTWDLDRHRTRLAATQEPVLREAYQGLLEFCERYPQTGGWTHSTIHYERVLREGIAGYRTRIETQHARATDEETCGFYRGLLTLTDAIGELCARVADHLEHLHFDDPLAEERRARLAAMYRDNVVMRPARTFHEAMTATTFLFALDGYDSLGRFDQFMWPYFVQDLDAGRITLDEARAMIAEFWQHIDYALGWNIALGGTTADGLDAANALTRLCLEVGTGQRRPNLALRLRRDTPDQVWNDALECISGGSGIPALYCEETYLRVIKETPLGVRATDRTEYCFGGCTELMVQGCSHVGSLDADINIAWHLEQAIHAYLPTSSTFEEFYQAFLGVYRRHVAEVTEQVNTWQRLRAQVFPQMIRSLLTDDCIDRGRSFHDSGARYNWSILNIGGLSNVIDALAAVREVVFTTGEITGADLCTALQADFAGFAALRARLERCPKFGNDHADVDALAHRLSGEIYGELQRYAPWRGGKFLAGTLMFITYGQAGAAVGALPDGRGAGEPIADSAGPVQGRDRSGPTAMLRSVTRLQHALAPGTLVVNMRLASELFRTPEGRAHVRSLIRSYFDMGGMQVQLNVVDQETLQDAIAYPERHRNLVVRIGGYSEYFIGLDPMLQQTIIERTIHV